MDRLKENPSDIEIIQEFPSLSLRYWKGLMEIKRTIQESQAPKLRLDLDVVCLWGEPGSGKTRKALKELGEDCFMMSACSPEWWDGYQGQKAVLIDDYRNSWPVTRLLNVLDIYPVRLPIKGSFTYLKARRIYLTSNLHPQAWYPNVEEMTKQALIRRFTYIQEMKRKPSLAIVQRPVDLNPNGLPQNLEKFGNQNTSEEEKQKNDEFIESLLDLTDE